MQFTDSLLFLDLSQTLLFIVPKWYRDILLSFISAVFIDFQLYSRCYKLCVMILGRKVASFLAGGCTFLAFYEFTEYRYGTQNNHFYLNQ